ncbi:hypothetical protein EST38_g13289 [Candolleomyces aberdarensis]|uniref:Uncharacterized protein n=1 Tax=Candolleomyces aberdarensis TaxID=2316362 RepID=A0A4Q2D322_9AGAR|nr:hypothetical protein EST38_g13289 [Candolleomyces aberdarensis]
MKNIKVSRNVAFNHNQEVKAVDTPGLGLEEGLDVPNISPITDQRNKITSQSSSPAQAPYQMLTKDDNPTSDNEIPLENLADLLQPQTSKLHNRKIMIDYKKAGNPDTRKPAESALNRERTRQLNKARREKEQERTLLSKTTIEEVIDVDAPLPRDVQEALGDSESQEWLGAVMEELDNLKRMGTWEMEELQKG